MAFYIIALMEYVERRKLCRKIRGHRTGSHNIVRYDIPWYCFDEIDVTGCKLARTI